MGTVGDSIKIAMRNTPVVALIGDKFWEQSALVARAQGLSDLPRVKLPYPLAGSGADEPAPRGRRHRRRRTPSRSAWPRALTMDLFEAVDESAACEMLHDLGCTDGLPVIVPTPDAGRRDAGGRTVRSPPTR